MRQRLEMVKRMPAPNVIPAEPGWSNIGWVDGNLYEEQIVAWSFELHQCEDQEETSAYGISPSGFNSRAGIWCAFRDPSGQIFANPYEVYANEEELIGAMRERDSQICNESAKKELH